MPESITQFNNMGFQDEDALEERDSILEERLELAFNGFEDHLKGLTRINETILTKVETLGKVQPVWATEVCLNFVHDTCSRFFFLFLFINSCWRKFDSSQLMLQK